jgi:signal transduction histidine kinase
MEGGVMGHFWKISEAGAVSVLLGLMAVASVSAAEPATPEEANAMLTRAVAALQADETAALAAFNAGADGFKENDLYVFCGDAETGIATAHGMEPWRAGKSNLRGQVDVNGKAYGEEIYAVAQEGALVVVEYAWPRPGEETPVPKASYVTKVGDQICGVGYYK